MWRISIHHDFDALGVPFHPVVVIGLGKNLLFKSVLAHCAVGSFLASLKTDNIIVDKTCLVLPVFVGIVLFFVYLI